MTAAALAEARGVLGGSLKDNRARGVLAVLAIALGVALGYAIQLITHSAVNELALGVQTLSGDADLQVHGPKNGFDERLYGQIARLSEIAAASPVLEVDAKLVDRDEPLSIVGIDAFRASEVEPALVADAQDRLDLFRPDTLFLSPAALQWLGLAQGDTLAVQVGLREVRLRIGGSLPGASRRRFGVMDIAGAQSVFERTGSLNRLDLRVQPGTDVEAFRERLTRRMPAGVGSSVHRRALRRARACRAPTG
jgi:putative ABC transport system permease protein